MEFLTDEEEKILERFRKEKEISWASGELSENDVKTVSGLVEKGLIDVKFYHGGGRIVSWRINERQTE